MEKPGAGWMQLSSTCSTPPTCRCARSAPNTQLTELPCASVQLYVGASGRSRDTRSGDSRERAARQGSWRERVAHQGSPSAPMQPASRLSPVPAGGRKPRRALETRQCARVTEAQAAGVLARSGDLQAAARTRQQRRDPVHHRPNPPASLAAQTAPSVSEAMPSVQTSFHVHLGRTSGSQISFICT